MTFIIGNEARTSKNKICTMKTQNLRIAVLVIFLISITYFYFCDFELNMIKTGTYFSYTISNNWGIAAEILLTSH